MKTEIKSKYTEIIANEGMVLSKETDDGRIFAHKASTSNPDAWEEWTEEDAAAWEAEHQVKHNV